MNSLLDYPLGIKPPLLMRERCYTCVCLSKVTQLFELYFHLILHWRVFLGENVCKKIRIETLKSSLYFTSPFLNVE
jgi:hypothetical protein